MFANAKNSSDDIIIRLIMDINTTIQKKSLAEEVSSLIREQINDGKLTKGEKLPTEPELMKLFGVGRSTVREAIKMLVNMGYLSVQQGRGTFVESITETNEPFHQRLKRADIQELREVRDIIEAPIARLAAQRRTKIDLENMKRYIQERGEAAKSGDVGRCIAADINFHNSIARATHNEILSELYHSMTVHLTSGYDYIYEDTTYLMKSQPLHERLLHHIETGNIESAMRAAKLLWKDVNIEKESDEEHFN